MELVEGKDLSEHTFRGPIPIDEAMPIALQIAEALEAAHEAGVIHRDLKPANIKVRDDGTVKVLDFGLAKAMDQGSGMSDQGPGTRANSPTITAPAMTMSGVTLGTAAYMSPEQAKGRPVDRRTTPLFRMHNATRTTSRPMYAVGPDGRILVVESEADAGAPITLLLNWNPAARP